MRHNQNERPKLEACPKCDYVACICQMLKHDRGCQKRKAVLDTHPIECEPHKAIACPDCFPCNCSLGKAATAGAV